MAVVNCFVAHLDTLRKGKNLVGEAVACEGSETAGIARAIRCNLLEENALLESVLATAGACLAEDAKGSRDGLPLGSRWWRGRCIEQCRVRGFFLLPFAGYLRKEFVESGKLVGRG